MWIIFFIFQKYIDKKELNLVCCHLQPKKKWSLDLIPHGTRSHPLAVCFINQSCYLPESFIYPRKFQYMKKALTWQRSTHAPHGLFFLCQSKYKSGFWPQTVLLNRRHCASGWWSWRARTWVSGYRVLWQVCALMAGSGLRHPDGVIKMARRDDWWEQQEPLFPLKDWGSWPVQQTDFCWCHWKVPGIFWAHRRCLSNSLIEVLRQHNRAGCAHVI